MKREVMRVHIDGRRWSDLLKMSQKCPFFSFTEQKFDILIPNDKNERKQNIYAGGQLRRLPIKTKSN